MPTDPQAPGLRGAERRFTALYTQCRPRMERTALRILKNRQDAEDAVQNAFCRLLRHAERLDTIPPEEQPFWVSAIVRNEALALLRKRHGDVPLEDRDGAADLSGSGTEYCELVSLIRQLPAPYRETMEKKLLEGWSDTEIAAHLGISQTAASTRVYRGRALLKKALRAALSAALAVLLGLGVLLAVSPAARAAAARLITELYQKSIVYRYTQPPRLDALPPYAVTALPEGFWEAARLDAPGHGLVFCTNDTGEWLCFESFLMAQGGATYFPTEGRTASAQPVGGLPGQFWEADRPGAFNILAWTDAEQGVRFHIVGLWSREELLRMAESVSRSDTAEGSSKEGHEE